MKRGMVVAFGYWGTIQGYSIYLRQYDLYSVKSWNFYHSNVKRYLSSWDYRYLMEEINENSFDKHSKLPKPVKHRKESLQENKH